MKKYAVSQHAVERAIQRLGQPVHNAKNHLIQLMQTAVFNGVVPGKLGPCRIYDHYATRTRMIVAEDNDTIVTVYSMDSVKGGAPSQVITTSGLLADAIKTTIARELQRHSALSVVLIASIPCASRI